MRSKRLKMYLVVLSAVLSANFLVPQAQAGLMAAKGTPQQIPAPAAVQLSEPSELPDPALEVDWIAGMAMGKGCRGQGVAQGAVCSYGSTLPPPGPLAEGLLGDLPPTSVGAFSIPTGSDPEGASDVPVPGTLVLFGLGLASLGVAGRRRRENLNRHKIHGGLVARIE